MSSALGFSKKLGRGWNTPVIVPGLVAEITELTQACPLLQAVFSFLLTRFQVGWRC